MDQQTEPLNGSNAAVAEPPPVKPAAPATPKGPGTIADRLEEYKNMPGLFQDTPKPAAAPAAKSADDEIPAELKNEKGGINWKKYREDSAKLKAYDELDKKYKATAAEMETLKKAPKSPANNEEIEALKRERDDYSRRLKIVDLERHPDFQKHYSQREEVALNKLKEVGGDRLVDLVKMPKSELKKQGLDAIFSELTQFEQAQLVADMREWEAIKAEKSAEIKRMNEDPDGYRQQVSDAEKKRQAQRDAEQQRIAEIDAANEQRIFDEAFSKALDAKDGLYVFQKRDGDEKWNQQVAEMEKTARALYSGEAEPETLARASLWAAAAPAFLQDSLAKAQQIDALLKENASLKAATPRPGGGSDPAQPDGLSNLSVTDRIMKQAAGTLK